MAAIYDEIGKRYILGRRTDPKIAAQIHNSLSGAESVLNVGAGTGSYEPPHILVKAVEPSEAMINQRAEASAPATQAKAESLPFKDGSFSHCMTVLSMHHWENREKAFSEIKRVTRNRFVAITWDPSSRPFWLTRDYFPEVHDIDKQIFPSLTEFNNSFERVDVSVLRIPADCVDGFLGAYWRRPEAYLDELVRANMSTFSKIPNLNAGLAQLRSDLESGLWESGNEDILNSAYLDVGYRILIAELAGGDLA